MRLPAANKPYWKEGTKHGIKSRDPRRKRTCWPPLRGSPRRGTATPTSPVRPARRGTADRHIFLETAENEKEHAKVFFSSSRAGGRDHGRLSGGRDRQDQGEPHGRSGWGKAGVVDPLCDFAKTARPRAPRGGPLLDQIAKVEKFHEARYRKLIHNFVKKTVFKRRSRSSGTASLRLHLRGRQTPEGCPACLNPSPITRSGRELLGSAAETLQGSAPIRGPSGGALPVYPLPTSGRIRSIRNQTRNRGPSAVLSACVLSLLRRSAAICGLSFSSPIRSGKPLALVPPFLLEE